MDALRHLLAHFINLTKLLYLHPIVVSENITESLHHWVLRERFPRFVKVTRGRFSQLMSTKKLLVMAVLEENKLGEITPDMEAFRAMLHSVMDNHIDRYRPHYQFGWTGSPDLANSVAMDTLSVSIDFVLPPPVINILQK